MGIFHALRGSSDEPQLSPELKKRLDELDERNAKLNKRVDVLELDWAEWFDKFRLMFARLSKRIKDAANAEPDAPQSLQDAPESTNPRAVAYDRPYLNRGGATARRNY